MVKKSNKQVVWIIIIVIIAVGFIPFIQVWQSTYDRLNEDGTRTKGETYRKVGLWDWFFTIAIPSIFKDKSVSVIY